MNLFQSTHIPFRFTILRAFQKTLRVRLRRGLLLGSSAAWALTNCSAPVAAQSASNVPVLAPLPLPTNVRPVTFVPPAKRSVNISDKTKASVWPLVNRAATLLQSRRTAQALVLYRRAYAIDPTNAYAGPGVATSQIILGRFNDAAATYRAFLAYAPNDAKALRGLADALTYAQKSREALGVNNYILAREPNDFASAFQNAQIATSLRSYVAADNNFRRAVSAQPKNSAVQSDLYAAWGESFSYRRDPRAVANFQRALSLNPNSSKARVGLANYYSYTGQFASAAPLYQSALVLEPRNAALLISYGEALTFSQKPAAAIAPFRAALQIQPNNAKARLGLGRALVYAGRNEEGLVQLRPVLNRDPNNIAALEASAQAQLVLRSPSSLDTYTKLLARQTNPAQRARTLASIGDLKSASRDAAGLAGAIQAYQQAAQLAPRDLKINLTLAQLLSYSERWSDVRTVSNRVLSISPNNPQALALQLQAELKDVNSNPATARALAARLENTTPATAEESLQLAQALRDAGNLPASQRLLIRAASLVKDPTTGLRLANATRDAGDYTGATSLYNRLLNSDPKNVQARLGLAQTLIYNRDLAAAQEQILLIQGIDRDNADANLLLAQIQLRSNTTNSRDEAVRLANEILRKDPSNAEARAIVGAALSARGRYADAVAQFRAALTTQPDNLDVRLNLARNLYYSRDIEGAISQYRDVIGRAPADALPRLELAQIFLDRNRFSDAETLYNEVLALRRGANTLAAVRRARETQTLLRLSPLSRENSPIQIETRSLSQLKPHVGKRRIVENKAPKKRVLIAQMPGTASGVPVPFVTDPALGSATAPNTSQAPPTSNSPVTTLPAPVENGAPIVPAVPIVPETPLAPPGAPSPLDPTVADQTAALRGLGEIRRRQGRFAEAAIFFQQALSLDANNLEARVGFAQTLRAQNNLTEALAETDRALAVDSQNIAARVLRAQLLADTGKTDEARTELSALVASVPQNAPLETYLQLASAFNSTRNYDAAISLLDVATTQYPNEPTPVRLKAESLSLARRFPEALTIYESLIAADSQDSDAVLGKARVYNYSDDLANAEATYRQVLTLQPENYGATSELADVLGRRANYPEAIRLYQVAIQANPGDLNTRVELSRVQRYAGDFGDAEATLNQILEADERFVPALTERGILRGTQSSYAAGITDLQRALEIAPSDLNAQLGLAEVQSYSGNYAASIVGYRAVLTRDPQNFKARTELASVLGLSGQTTAALTEIDGVLTQNPADTRAKLTKGDILARARRTSEAAAIYNEVLANDANNLRARTGLADAYIIARRYDDAVKIYDALIVTEPTNSAYKIQRARALGYGGRNSEAVASLRSVVIAEPTNIAARLALAEAGTNSGDAALQKAAIADYRGILTVDANNTAAKLGLARALSYTGEYDESQTLLNGILASAPQNQEARLALADTQRFAGNAFDARKNYLQVLATDPTNSSATQGLGFTQRSTASSLGIAINTYNDSNDVRLSGVTLTPTLRTKALTLGLIAQSGRFSQGGVSRDRRNLGILLARQFGPVQARVILSRLKYDGVPEKTLFDVNLLRQKSARQRLSLGVGRRDIFESDFAVRTGTTATVYRAFYALPLGERFDFEAAANYYRYSDDNSRLSLLPSLYYRFSPKNPSLRVGLGYTYDDTDETRVIGGEFKYYTPQNFRSTSLLADYIVDQGATRYGISAAKALTNSAGDNDTSRPADTLFFFGERDLGDRLSVFLNGGFVRADEFDSNEFGAGVNLFF